MESFSLFVEENKNITRNGCAMYLGTAEAAIACHDDDHDNDNYANDDDGNCDNRQRRHNILIL